MNFSSSLSIREFDLILIYLPHFDWNLRNRILKFKNPNIPAKIHLLLRPNNTFKFHVSSFFSIRSFIVKEFSSEELGAAFFPTEAWGQPLTFDLGPAGLHHPALLHTALHGPPMVGFFPWILHLTIEKLANFLRMYYLSGWADRVYMCM